LKNLGATTSISNYYLENGKLESIYDNNGNVQAKYMRGSVIDEVVNGFQTNSGALTNYTYHHDALESVLGQSGNTGTVVAAQGYTSFGSTVNATGSSNNTLKFTGREQDIETGLYYYRARYYDSLTGRFLSEDPIRSGINFYVYCNNNPVNCSDPLGLYDLTAQFGFHLPISPGLAAGPLWSWTAANYSNTAYNSPTTFTANPVVPEIVFGGIGDIGGSYGISNISGIAGNSGYQLNFGLNKFFGVQLTFVDNQNTTLSFFNPARYIDGISAGLGFGYAAPVNVSRTVDPNKIKIGNTSSQQQKLTNSGYNINAAVANQVAASALNAATNSAMDAVNSAISPPGVPQAAAPTATLSTELIGFGGAADGGFILYPNMSNTSQIQNVYSKK
jgi:RHS repeat-associated protein